MNKREGFTLLELMIVILVIILLFLVFKAIESKVKKSAQRIICGGNLKSLGNAMVVYGNDYDDNFPQLGKGIWAKELGYSYEDNTFSPFDFTGDCTITSSLYLLIRVTDVSPEIFVCPSSEESVFEGENSKDLNLTELWDFGSNPYPHVSYAYHNPYGKFPPDYIRTATFAIAADMNPWIKYGDFVTGGLNNMPPQIIDTNTPSTWKLGNAMPHRINEKNTFVEGQNVLHGDGHTEFQTQPNVGIKYDNIYTYWSTDQNPTDQDKQGGTAPTGRSAENDAKSPEDSFLVL